MHKLAVYTKTTRLVVLTALTLILASPSAPRRASFVSESSKELLKHRLLHPPTVDTIGTAMLYLFNASLPPLFP